MTYHAIQGILHAHKGVERLPVAPKSVGNACRSILSANVDVDWAFVQTGSYTDVQGAYSSFEKDVDGYSRELFSKGLLAVPEIVVSVQQLKY